MLLLSLVISFVWIVFCFFRKSKLNVKEPRSNANLYFGITAARSDAPQRVLAEQKQKKKMNLKYKFY